jgi:hypothetical protein
VGDNLTGGRCGGVCGGDLYWVDFGGIFWFPPVDSYT